MVVDVGLNAKLNLKNNHNLLINYINHFPMMIYGYPINFRCHNVSYLFIYFFLSLTTYRWWFDQKQSRTKITISSTRESFTIEVPHRILFTWNISNYFSLHIRVFGECEFNYTGICLLTLHYERIGCVLNTNNITFTVLSTNVIVRLTAHFFGSVNVMTKRKSVVPLYV